MEKTPVHFCLLDHESIPWSNTLGSELPSGSGMHYTEGSTLSALISAHVCTCTHMHACTHLPCSAIPALPGLQESQASTGLLYGQRRISAGSRVRAWSMDKVTVHWVAGVKLIQGQGQRSAREQDFLDALCLCSQVYPPSNVPSQGAAGRAKTQGPHREPLQLVKGGAGGGRAWADSCEVRFHLRGSGGRSHFQSALYHFQYH